MAEFSPSLNFILNASAPSYLGYIAKRAGVKRYIYAGSCSVYGYTVDELYNEESPAMSNYPYGISKLQGEQAAMQMADDNFSVICFRQGTVSGYSPRMRLDLIVNTMFKTALEKKEIIINNPSIWRPILSIEDAASAYIRAIEASPKISGIFNVASGNYTVGEVADFVKLVVEQTYKTPIKLNIKNIQDFRNYKVSVERAINILSFKPKHDVESILNNLVANLEKFKDFENPNYYNIRVFKTIKPVFSL
jgi:nucleoside-diphosphate-sugar epimerase